MKIPYSEIFKLPDLLDNFIELYSRLLIGMQKPIEKAIQEARQRVFEELKNKKCHDRHVFRINSSVFGLFRHDWGFCNFFLLYYSLYLRLVMMMR